MGVNDADLSEANLEMLSPNKGKMIQVFKKNGKKDCRIQFRIERKEKARWIDFIENNDFFKDLTDLIVKSVGYTMNRGHDREDLLNMENLFLSNILAMVGDLDRLKEVHEEIFNSSWKFRCEGCYNVK